MGGAVRPSHDFVALAPTGKFGESRGLFPCMQGEKHEHVCEIHCRSHPYA